MRHPRMKRAALVATLAVLSSCTFVAGLDADYRVCPGKAGPLTGSHPAGDGWTDLRFALVEDGKFARSPYVEIPSVSAVLIVSDFDASVPASAKILGVAVTIRRAANALNSVTDDQVILVDGTTPIGAAKADKESWSTDFQDRPYGSASDTWDAALTPDTINSPSFGVGIACSADGGVDSGRHCYVDSISATVHYRCE